MADLKEVIYNLERCICHVQDACRDCSKFKGEKGLNCMEELMADALELLKQQEPVDKEKDQRLKTGDILRNDWAGEDNPRKYTMYIRRGKLGNQKTIDCLSADGQIVHHYESDNRLVVVGHMNSYDKFKSALSQMRSYQVDCDQMPCDAVELLKEQEIVRCRDCIYYNSEPDSHGDYCNKIHWSRGLDWFCADGKRG